MIIFLWIFRSRLFRLNLPASLSPNRNRGFLLFVFYYENLGGGISSSKYFNRFREKFSLQETYTLEKYYINNYNVKQSWF